MYETFKSVFQKFIWEIYSKNIFSNMFDAIVGTSLANIAKEAFLNGQSLYGSVRLSSLKCTQVLVGIC